MSAHRWRMRAPALCLVATLGVACRAPEPVPRTTGERLVAGGDAERGEVLLHEFGCGACHMIPGVLAARGQTGPPLDAYAERLFIAGALPNSAENLVAWIVDPQAIEPGTAMPDLGVSEERARHMTAYLYTLERGREWRLPRVLRLPPADGAWRSVTR